MPQKRLTDVFILTADSNILCFKAYNENAKAKGIAVKNGLNVSTLAERLVEKNRLSVKYG